jgi:acylphosphatase
MAAKRSQAPTHRAHVFYTGRVQGVGFRYTAEGIAHRVGVNGFVKNLSDGRVEVVCEGTKDKVDAFLEEVRQSTLGPHIQKADCRWEDPTGVYSDFTVEFHL